MHRFELKLASGKVVSWTGDTGEDAARRYVSEHPEATVIAARTPPVGIHVVHPAQIVG